MTRDDKLAMLLFAVIFALAGIIRFRASRRYKTAIQSWAAQNKLELMDARYRWFCYPIFSFGPSNAIYRIQVRTDEGCEKCGYIQVGGPYGIGDTIKVKWDKNG